MVELIPRAVLFGNPERASPQMSPDGNQVAWLGPRDGALNVWVAPFDDQSGLDMGAARPVTNDRHRDVRLFDWSADGRRILYLQGSGSDEEWRLYDIDLATSQCRDLTPYEGAQARIIAIEARHPEEVLIGLNRDDPQLHDLYRLDLGSGQLKKEITNVGFLEWLADTDLVVRAAIAQEPDGSCTLLVRRTTQDEWHGVAHFDGEDAMSTVLEAFSAGGDAVLSVTSAGSDTLRLVSIDTTSGDFEVLAEEPGADVHQVWLHPVTKAPQVVSFLKERSHYRALEPAVAEDLERARRIHPGDLFLASGDDAYQKWLIGFTNDAGPVPYYVYNRATGAAHFLFDHRTELSRYELAPMEPFSFTARDGLVINGYASFPPGTEPHGLPAVLVVHGGPWVRDVWGFHPEAQWLANRGYLCLQVNFRGSGGYGKAFLDAGDREWGAKMHDDLVDAVGFAVAQGWADRKRVAIFGASYGGYAALVGASFTPDVFCCAVDLDGPSNLKTLIQTVPPHWATMVTQFHRRVGNPTEDEDFLWSRSPLSRVKDIRIPVLIAQGALDPRVKRSEVDQIVKAMRKAGVEHEYLLFADEGHGLSKPENRLRFYAAAERFLARHLGGWAES
jgi:dipeptidyl aminopeptidase/acylaminoacyl peptidase